MSDGWAVAAGTLVALVIGAVAAAVVSILNARHAHKKEDDESAVAQYVRAIGEYKSLVERQDKQLSHMQEAIEDLQAGELACQVQVSELYGHNTLIHDLFSRYVRSAGGDPSEIPPLPPRPSMRESRERRERTEFLKRSAQQNTGLLHQATQVINRTPPPAPPGGGPKP